MNPEHSSCDHTRTPTLALQLNSYPVLPDNSYYLMFLTFFMSSVEVRSSVIVAAEEDPEP